MDIKLNHILYSTLFSGLGVFSFFLLANYVELSDNVSDALYSLGMFLFFIVAFNLLGYSTIHLTTWVDNQYSVNIYRRRKLIFIYTMVMVMFFFAQLWTASDCQAFGWCITSFCFSQRRVAYIDSSLAGGVGDFRLTAC